MTVGSEISNLTAGELKKALFKKEISAKEILDNTYKRIDQVEDKIQALNCLTKELAYKTAKKVDEKIKNGEKLSPLAGIPIIVKDNICIKDTKTTASSKILENFISPYDATVSKKLKDNLVPIVAKANLDEFAMGSSNENSAFKPVKNPWNLNKVPGGSSGGSGAAVASGESTVSLGSDTGGSIRLPASYCGIVGMKPTYGRVSRFGLLAFASSLDQIGPFGRCVEDVALALQVIGGYDPYDSTSLDKEVPDYCANLNKDINGMKIGVISELLSNGVQPEVKESVENAIKLYEKLGAKVEEVSIPHNKYAIATYYILAMSEASSNLARYDSVKYGHRADNPKNAIEMYMKSREEGFGEEVKRRIMIGTYSLSSGYYDAYYKKAQQVRRLIQEDFDKAWNNFDLLISPTCPNTAFDLNSKTEDPLSMYLMDICTITANLAGVPALSLPCGLDNEGMPIGLQIIGPALGEEKLLNAAYKLEQEVNFDKKPDI